MGYGGLCRCLERDKVSLGAYFPSGWDLVVCGPWVISAIPVASRCMIMILRGGRAGFLKWINFCETELNGQTNR